jgi:hypothetical protein
MLITLRVGINEPTDGRDGAALDALNLRSWEAASDLIRGWDASGRIGVVKPEVPTVREAVDKVFADAQARHLSSSTISKQRNVLEKRLMPWCDSHGTSLLKNLDVDARLRRPGPVTETRG